MSATGHPLRIPPTASSYHLGQGLGTRNYTLPGRCRRSIQLGGLACWSKLETTHNSDQESTRTLGNRRCITNAGFNLVLHQSSSMPKKK
ncbi:conserved hypothetical protein [Coccidioides posadasii str. Silveira]|uniref:Uncharacterized protein n=1 Tax=Coccidioides posadasii (strain RMSCC 757 / Silveira) TaxID=443226 RepID=E9DBJ2_COCPS|nr:conserved hypothetical protein [Coccidioides posadasii str. Silveira]